MAQQQGLMGLLSGASNINNQAAGIKPAQQQGPGGADQSFESYLKKLLGSGGSAATPEAMPMSAGAGMGGAGASDLGGMAAIA